MAITRTAMIDDDGSGTTGTIINNAWKTEFYDQIDTALVIAGWPGGNTGQIAFPATANLSGGANVLDDYEEGTYVPTDGSDAGLTFTSAIGQYVKVGQHVTIGINLTFPTTSNGSNASIVLPFLAGAAVHWAVTIAYVSPLSTPFTGFIFQGSNRIEFRAFGGAVITNQQLSGATLWMTAAYQVHYTL
jgi:hypothetical protein